MSASVLFDELGPKGRARVRIATVASTVLIALLVFLALRRLADHGQFDGDMWSPFTEPDVLKLLLSGAWTTIRMAIVAMAVALVLGALLALSRLGTNAAIRLLGTTYIEVFRALPLLLLVFLTARGLDHYGIHIPGFWQMVVALVLYNSAVLAEIFRAGILSLDRGQSEAAYAVGLTYGQSMRFVLVPQAVRRMLPAIVSQLVTLLKDTSLAFVIPVEGELLSDGQRLGEYYTNLLPTYFVVASIYIAICFALSRLARRLEAKQVRRYGATPMAVGGVEELAALTAAAMAEEETGKAPDRDH